MRECGKHEITVEKLIDIVHNYTDPIRIRVVMGNAWLTCEEAKRMHDFVLTDNLSYLNKKECERILKYYKDVPVWNLTVWTDGPVRTEKGRTFYAGIEARCDYKDMREGWLAERADRDRERKRAYRKRKKEEKQ